MDASQLEALIEREITDAEATVSTPRDPDDDKHYAVEVVSPAFSGKSLVDQHQLVHDALEGVLTEEVHAIELRTHTPDEA
jgi:stress-induced morphogen